MYFIVNYTRCRWDNYYCEICNYFSMLTLTLTGGLQNFIIQYRKHCYSTSASVIVIQYTHDNFWRWQHSHKGTTDVL